MHPTVGSVGDVYHNATAESFFVTLERELLERRTFKTKLEARMAVFTSIEAGTTHGVVTCRSGRDQR